MNHNIAHGVLHFPVRIRPPLECWRLVESAESTDPQIFIADMSILATTGMHGAMVRLTRLGLITIATFCAR